jgi:hypothetical protein
VDGEDEISGGRDDGTSEDQMTAERTDDGGGGGDYAFVRVCVCMRACLQGRRFRMRTSGDG